MPILPAHTAHYHFITANLPADTFEVVQFVGVEEVSRLYRFEIELVSTDPSIDFAAVINQPAKLVMRRQGEDDLPIHGLVVHFEQGGLLVSREGRDYISYRAILAPRAWLLTLNFQSQIFQEENIEQIITKVLEGGGLVPNTHFRFDFADPGIYKPKEYITQYEERDLEFMFRRLEFEGIWFFFEQAANHEVLVITDDPSKNLPIVGSSTQVAYHRMGGMTVEDDQEIIDRLIYHERVVTGTYAAADRNYRTPDTELRVESNINTDMPGRVYEHSIHFKDMEEGNRLAQVRNQEFECQRRVMNGNGTCQRFHAGHIFALANFYRRDVNGDCFLIRVRHVGSQRAMMGLTSERERVYVNEFTCIPAAVAFRPPRKTPQPKLPGLMSATIETQGGDYALLDDQGRYKCKMWWDERQKGPTEASKAIRLAEPYAGSEFGFHFPLQAGAELLYACLDGHMDRPLGIASAPHPSQASPVTSANNMRNILRTAAQNELYMHDERGNERVWIYSPYATSIIQLGSPSLANEGIAMSTTETVQAYADNGIILKAGGGFVPQSDLADFTTGLTTAGAALEGIAAAVGAGFDIGTFVNLATTFASWGVGLKYPGIFGVAQGGIGLSTPNNLSAFTGMGIGLFTGGGVDIGALTNGVKIGAVAGGFNVYVGFGGISLRTGVGDVYTYAKTGNIKEEAKVNIEELALTGDIKEHAKVNIEELAETGSIVMRAPSDEGSIEGEAGANIDFEAKKDVFIQSLEESVNISAKKDINIVGEVNGMIEFKGDSLVLKCGGSCITLNQSGIITIEGDAVDILASEEVTLEGKGVVAEGTSNVKITGGKITSSSTGPHTIEGNPVKLN